MRRVYRAGRPLLFPWSLLCLSWLILVGVFLTRRDVWLDHDYLLGSGRLSWQVALLLFVPSWQVMVLAMMLPGLFTKLLWLAPSKGRCWPIQFLFILGYAAAWTLFAVGAFGGDSLLHDLVRHWNWLYLHTRWISGGLLIVSGIFQWSSWKRHCLARFRPMKYSGHTPWLSGWRYGLWDVACNWSLMLVMFGIGMHSFLLLTSLSAVMWIEHAGSASNIIPRVIGIGCFLAAILWLFII